MEGNKIPQVTFKCRVDSDWQDVTTQDLFAGKKVGIFSLPGAFTPTCSSTHLPGYEAYYDALQSAGLDEIYCVSVNDAFVMNAWFRDEKIEKVKAIGVGEGVFTQGMGMMVNKPKQGFGMRSWRYSMLVDNGEVVKVFEEPGKNNASDDDDPFTVSDADTMINFLKNK